MRRAAAWGLPLFMAALAIALWLGPYRHMGLWTEGGLTDIPVYQRSSDGTAAGSLPYRDQALEYPPGAALLFWVARFMPGNYTDGFVSLMMVAWATATAGGVFAAMALGYRRWRQIAVGLVMAAAPLLLGELVATRFDAVVAAILAWVLVAAVTERWRTMWTLMGVAALIKLTPLILVPLLLVWHSHRRSRGEALRGAGFGAGLVAMVVVPIAALAPSGLWDMLAYHIKRPPQIESLASSYMLLLHNLADVPVVVRDAYGSQGLDGRGVSMVAALVTAAGVFFLVGTVLVTARGVPPLRRGPDAALLASAFACTLAVLIVTAKVFSPQFIVWLLPAALLAGGPYGVAALGTTVVAALATQAYFPSRYWDLVALHEGPIWMLVIRNAVMICLVAMLWPRPKAHRRRAAVTLRSSAGVAAAEQAPRARYLAD